MLIDHLYFQFTHHPLQVPSNPTMNPQSKARIHASHFSSLQNLDFLL